ncbi:MAG: hypothetical protein QNJ41_17945 [Xenococcaceae cyanobacterium MO_188.B32]|nr:hypothetical protein [Xenococcaceae cyanobacterium MO_188.B32]
MRYIRKNDIEQFRREYALALLDQVMVCLNKFVEHGLGGGEMVNEAGKTLYFDVVCKYDQIKKKYGKKKTTRAQRERVKKRLKALEQQNNDLHTSAKHFD